ncbi:hypothetical protein A3D85_00520 [Candidatus Amesbacteria bacterium RIFCSPHIGHO2_02_FULL_47_9]|uniref:Uncharacterized protein n=1 Tax=Candidatus Amesbacteria bacterium RIFCSPHIGHO2_01_FULL_48_32b TaxID=1797253 RepID=A0A1F4YDL7_9BACT|nr:MAG: hypothetical protein A2876_01710 [Candidatus Amesbacteria bacterium RIFCSPHIGHO2_01_FULL_48_32b]OGD04908.1 MAG: hypothetical protein A3D85_00520 [Candidatus Amesbacteria bacterium RIFCSPHIGHO2_02_FULL_47_9]OGD07281.1 MAG: hypothetical protein A2899_04730 [Candidatus Amesbacteria bacterium RIFCSPLOWO2_01_FULL_49_25]
MLVETNTTETPRSAKLYTCGSWEIALGAWYLAAKASGRYKEPDLTQAIASAFTTLDNYPEDVKSRFGPLDQLRETMKDSLPTEESKLHFGTEQRELEKRQLQSVSDYLRKLSQHHPEMVRGVVTIESAAGKNIIHINQAELPKWPNHPKALEYLEDLVVNKPIAKRLQRNHHTSNRDLPKHEPAPPAPVPEPANPAPLTIYDSWSMKHRDQAIRKAFRSWGD